MYQTHCRDVQPEFALGITHGILIPELYLNCIKSENIWKLITRVNSHATRNEYSKRNFRRCFDYLWKMKEMKVMKIAQSLWQDPRIVKGLYQYLREAEGWKYAALYLRRDCLRCPCFLNLGKAIFCVLKFLCKYLSFTTKMTRVSNVRLSQHSLVQVIMHVLLYQLLTCWEEKPNTWSWRPDLK